ncbi:MAG: hypothetical protein ACFB0B_03975 [Thermonemataceae bacterium]
MKKGILIASLLLTLIYQSGTAQTSFCPDDPPLNPWLADSPYPIYHRNNYAQASTCIPGITAKDSVRIKVKDNIAGGTSPWIYLSDKYPNGERVILYSNSTHVFKFRDDGEKLVAIDSLKIDGNPYTSFGYNFLLTKNNVWFTYDPKYRPKLRKFTTLYKLTDTQPNNPDSKIKVVKTLNFGDHGINKVTMYSLNYNGQIVFYSHEDKKQNIFNVGIIDQDLNLVSHIKCKLLPGEKVNHNSIAVDETNAFYIVSTHRLMQFTWDNTVLKMGWEAKYDFVKDGPTGKWANGSGTTPTLMGWGEGKDKLVIVADGHANNNLVAFWREIPSDWQGLSGRDRRLADVIKIPYAKSFSKKFQSIENSPTVYGYDVAIAQFNGFLGYKCKNYKGVQKFRWDTEQDKLVLQWANDKVNMNGVLSYSSGSNLVYGSGKEEDCNYYYYGLDWDTGKIALRLLLGTKRRFPKDPFYDQGVNHIIDEEGNVYFSGSRSLVKIEKVKPVND